MSLYPIISSNYPKKKKKIVDNIYMHATSLCVLYGYANLFILHKKD